MRVFVSSWSGCDCGDWRYGVMGETHDYLLPCRFQWSRHSDPRPFRAVTGPKWQCPYLCLPFTGDTQAVGSPKELTEVRRRQ